MDPPYMVWYPNKAILQRDSSLSIKGFLNLSPLTRSCFWVFFLSPIMVQKCFHILDVKSELEYLYNSYVSSIFRTLRHWSREGILCFITNFCQMNWEDDHAGIPTDKHSCVRYSKEPLHQRSVRQLSQPVLFGDLAFTLMSAPRPQRRKTGCLPVMFVLQVLIPASTWLALFLLFSRCS